MEIAKEVVVRIFAFFSLGAPDLINLSWVKFYPMIEADELKEWAKEFMRVAVNESCPMYDVCTNLSKVKMEGAKSVCVACPYFNKIMEDETEKLIRKKIRDHGDIVNIPKACFRKTEMEDRMDIVISYPETINDYMKKKGTDFVLPEKGRYFLLYSGRKNKAPLGALTNTDQKAIERAEISFKNIKENVSLIRRNEDGSSILLATFLNKETFILGNDGEYLQAADKKPNPEIGLKKTERKKREQKINPDYSQYKVIPSFNEKTGKGRKPANWEVEIGDEVGKKKFLFQQTPMPDICQLALEFASRQMSISIVQSLGGTRNEFDWAEKLSSYPVRSRIRPENVKYLILKTALIDGFEQLSHLKDLHLCPSAPKLPCDDSQNPGSSLLSTIKPKWEIFFGEKLIHGFNAETPVIAASLTSEIAEILGFERSLFILKRNHKQGKPLSYNWREKLLKLSYAEECTLKNHILSIKKAAEEALIVKRFRQRQQEKASNLITENTAIRGWTVESDEDVYDDLKVGKTVENSDFAASFEAKINKEDLDSVENTPDLVKLGSLFGLDVERMLRLHNQGAEFDTPSGIILAMIPVSQIDANEKQPRKYFEKMALRFLASSMVSKDADNKYAGNHTPILVTERDGRFFLIEGERRVRSARKNNTEKIFALISPPMMDNEVLFQSCLANFSKQDMTLIEKASAYQMILEEKNFNQSELANAVGMTPGHICNVLKVFKVVKRILEKLEQRIISPGTALYFGSYKKEHQWDMYRKLEEQIEVDHITGPSLRALIRQVAEDAGYKPIDKRVKTVAETNVSEFKRIVTSMNNLCSIINDMTMEKIQEVESEKMRTMKYSLSSVIEKMLEMYERLSRLTGGGQISKTSGEKMMAMLKSILEDVDSED